MPATCRIGDVFSGICCCHPPIPCIGMSGVIVTGAGTNQTEGSPVSRIGDIGIGGCGHSTVIVTGSGTAQSEGSSISRVGDAVAGCIVGSIVTGAGTHTTG